MKRLVTNQILNHAIMWCLMLVALSLLILKQQSNEPRILSIAIPSFTKADLVQPQDFPFQPEWSEAVYDPDRFLDVVYEKQLMRHAMLRHFYTSNVRFCPEFKELHEVLVSWNVDPDPILRMKLFEPLVALELVRQSLSADPELMAPKTRKRFEKLRVNLRSDLSRLISQWVGSSFHGKMDALTQIRPREGFGIPDTRIRPGEPLLSR